jgi:hypothetical protein
MQQSVCRSECVNSACLFNLPSVPLLDEWRFSGQDAGTLRTEVRAWSLPASSFGCFPSKSFFPCCFRSSLDCLSFPALARISLRFYSCGELLNSATLLGGQSTGTIPKGATVKFLLVDVLFL